MTLEQNITRVTYRWDDQPGVVPGWYCESFDDSGQRDDSMKVWFPVNVDDFSEDDSSGLVAALRKAFPCAEIVRA